MDDPPADLGALPDPSDLASPRAGDLQRLWTPWRMRYVGGGPAEHDCLFCRRLAAVDDAESLILHRGEQAFAIMNLYPYNTGHLMLVPVDHVASPEDAPPAALAEVALLLPQVLRALRRVLRCAGFNVGLNVGAVAGAGVADHLHHHVVPRWEGDANFMPILAVTMVLPELIPVTYGKIRAELDRELRGSDAVACVVLADDRVLVEASSEGWCLPSATARPDEPLWRTALAMVDGLVGGGAEVLGWAGTGRAGTGPPALAIRVPVHAARTAPSPHLHWVVADQELHGPAAAAVAASLRRLAPNGGAA